MLSCDPYDEYISDNSSLKTAISKKLIVRFKKDKKLYCEDGQKLHNDFIKIIFDEKDSKNFHESLYFLISRINENLYESDKQMIQANELKKKESIMQN